MNIFPGETKPYIFGHRGYSKLAPENTLSSFNVILTKKVPGVELDVHLCKSGELVVTHDHNLKRVTGFDAIVEDMDYSEVKKLDAGLWKGENFKNEKIPLLEDVFDLLGSQVYYDIELKSMSSKPTGLAEKVFKLLQTYNLTERCIVSSFNPMQIKFFKAIAPSIPTASIYSSHEGVPWYLKHGEGRWIASADLLKPDHEKLNKIKLRYLKVFRKREIITWTVDTAEEAKMLVEEGVIGIISNDPANIGLI